MKKVREVKRVAKAGEKIKIVNVSITERKYDNGDILTVIKHVACDGLFLEHVIVEEHDVRILNHEYVILEEYDEFTLDDLKPCMMVELRNGKLVLVSESTLGLCLVWGNDVQFLDFLNFKNDMTYKCKYHGKEFDKLDIIKVYGFSIFPHKSINISTENRELLWERIEKSETELKIEQLEEKQRQITSEIEELRKGLK